MREIEKMDYRKEHVETVEFQGEAREYDVWDKDYWAKDGVDAPRFWIMPNATHGRIAISNEVPGRDYRQRMVFHELYEYESGKPVRCVDALKAELKTVPKSEMGDYVPFRREVFRELVGYWERQSDSDPHKNKVLPGARESLKYLEEMTGE